MEVNYKKEMKNLGKSNYFLETVHKIFFMGANFLDIFIERMSEIQYQNRILLKKMLQIDLKASKLNPKTMMDK